MSIVQFLYLLLRMWRQISVYRLTSQKRIIVCLLSFIFMVGIDSVGAGECAVTGPRVKLDSQSVDWTLVIASGQSCVRGLRSAAMTLESVSLGSPAQFGEVIVQGYSFVYRARTDFKGEDSFSVVMTGTNKGIRGTSIIRVLVSIR